MDKRVWNLETATLSEELKNRQEIDLDLCNNVKWASLFHKSKTIALVVGVGHKTVDYLVHIIRT